MLDEKSRLAVSEFLDGIEKSSVDAEITAGLNSMPSGFPGSPMSIAVENDRGVIYRIVTTSGISAFQHASKVLVRLGFEDRLASDFSGKSPYSCIFFRRARQS